GISAFEQQDACRAATGIGESLAQTDSHHRGPRPEAKLLPAAHCCQAFGMTALIRPAQADDIPALVQLRLANAHPHIDLAPSAHRQQDISAVYQYFHEALSSPDTSTPLILVAEVPGEVAGMAEVVIVPDPPGHQILIPRRTAQIHTVVLDGYRRKG